MNFCIAIIFFANIINIHCFSTRYVNLEQVEMGIGGWWKYGSLVFCFGPFRTTSFMKFVYNCKKTIGLIHFDLDFEFTPPPCSRGKKKDAFGNSKRETPNSLHIITRNTK